MNESKDIILNIIDDIENFNGDFRILDKNENIVFSNEEYLKDLPVDTFALNKDKAKYIISTDRPHENIEKLINNEEYPTERHYSVRSSPIYQDDKHLGTLEIFKDITSKINFERALNKQLGNVESDLNFAKIIQTKMLPNKGTYDNIILDYVYRPSHHLSGDIFDIKYINDKCLGIYMVDVAGHGIAASMMTVFIRQSMETIFERYKSPAQILIAMQEKFKELDLEANKYFTMFCGVYSIERHTFSYSNAGHNSVPFLFNDNNLQMLSSTGLPILSFDHDYEFEEHQVQVKPGDKLLFYTDGLTEARNSLGEEFGEDKIKQAIYRSQDGLLEDIVNEYDNFTDLPQKDDFALLLLEIK